MRLLRQQIDAKHGSGTATLLPEEPEDMWHAYNLLQPTDLLRARAIRRVTKTSDAGSTSSQRIVLDLTLSITSTDFDPASSELHVAGRVVSENEHVKLGSHHTLDLELHRKFTLEKGGESGWDSVALEMLREACDTERKVEMWAVVMGEGVANLCLITEFRTILRQRVEVGVPRKGRGRTEQYSKGMEKFHSTVLASLMRCLGLEGSGGGVGGAAAGQQSQQQQQDSDKTVPLLLASAGFHAQNFLQYIKAYATRTTNKPLLALIPSIVVAHTSGPGVHNLKEVLASPANASKFSDTKFTRETALMDRFMKHMREDDGRAWYGPREVERAVDKGAVGRGGGVLLINNSLFRSNSLAERKRWVALVDRVREVEGGEVRVLSSLHESGKRLEGLGNIAAILTYPLLDLDESDDEEVEGVLEDEEDMII